MEIVHYIMPIKFYNTITGANFHKLFLPKLAFSIKILTEVMPIVA
jgi:hypothetical protein